MPRGIFKTPEETKRRMRESHLCKKYKPMSKKGRINISEALKGRNLSEIAKEKISKNNAKYWAGKRRSLEDIEKFRRSHLGKKLSEKTKEKMSKVRMRDNNPNWQGGKSFELYGFDWTDLLKHSIRTRDCFVCQMCKKNGWIIHHIDYNKKNCNPENLITLCRSCHTKTNHNRNYWINYFGKI